MRAFFVLVLIVGLAGFSWWEHRSLGQRDKKIAALQSEVERLRPPVGATPQKRARVNYRRRITCPLCHGERQVVYDAGGKGDPMNRKTENCPVCLAKGYRDVSVKPGQHLCPDCKGMGIVASVVPGHRTRSANCVRCAATGVITALK